MRSSTCLNAQAVMVCYTQGQRQMNGFVFGLRDLFRMNNMVRA